MLNVLAWVTDVALPTPSFSDTVAHRRWAEAAAMGRCAEERYWKLFTAEQMAQSYVELYRKLL